MNWGFSCLLEIVSSLFLRYSFDVAWFCYCCIYKWLFGVFFSSSFIWFRCKHISLFLNFLFFSLVFLLAVKNLLFTHVSYSFISLTLRWFEALSFIQRYKLCFPLDISTCSEVLQILLLVWGRKTEWFFLLFEKIQSFSVPVVRLYFGLLSKHANLG